MKPCVSFCLCGTQENWDNRNKNKPEFKDMYKVIPGTIYVSYQGLALVTSQEWKDWLMGKTEIMPESTAE